MPPPCTATARRLEPAARLSRARRDGAPRRFISQLADITDHVRREGGVARERARFRSFAESMAAGVLIARRTHRVRERRGLEPITGFSATSC
jgi:PAS domain-containing protein